MFEYPIPTPNELGLRQSRQHWSVISTDKIQSMPKVPVPLRISFRICAPGEKQNLFLDLPPSEVQT